MFFSRNLSSNLFFRFQKEAHSEKQSRFFYHENFFQYSEIIILFIQGGNATFYEWMHYASILADINNVFISTTVVAITKIYICFNYSVRLDK